MTYDMPLFFRGAEDAWCGRHILSMPPSAVLSDVSSRPSEVPHCLNQTLAGWRQPVSRRSRQTAFSWPEQAA
ncbi:hypothetical protein E2C01_025859 [Portunus trituberculatus]|uniref:Uncharacterized protein n=1 Tax=Portunus trituberculatus TaxID=210409 RepID=A0A5B7EGM9_PORTR|nr:hypothetical protein [Portunus trituberculatus]